MRAPGSTSFLTCAMPATCAPLPTFAWPMTPECAPDHEVAEFRRARNAAWGHDYGNCGRSDVVAICTRL